VSPCTHAHTTNTRLHATETIITHVVRGGRTATATAAAGRWLAADGSGVGAALLQRRIAGRIAAAPAVRHVADHRPRHAAREHVARDAGHHATGERGRIPSVRLSPSKPPPATAAAAPPPTAAATPTTTPSSAAA